MRSPQGSLTADGSRRGVWLGAALIAAAALGAYSDSFFGPFVFDDPSSITSNPTIRHLWPIWAVLKAPHVAVTVESRPVLNLSLAINYAISGYNEWSYHALNVLILICSGLALFGIVRRSLLRMGASQSLIPALAVGLLWTLHPLQTEAVTYVIQRAESMMGLFYLLTFYCFIRGAEATDEAIAAATAGKRPFSYWFILSWLACLLGMGTKEVMVSAPLLVLLYDRAFFSGGFLKAWTRRATYYLGLVACWALLGVLIAAGGGNRNGSIGFGVAVSWWGYELTQFQAIGTYLKLAIWPHPLVFEYGTFWVKNGWTVVPWACLVLPLVFATLLALWRWPKWGVIGFWFFAILSPTSLIPGTSQMIVEHRMYLSLAAVLVAIVCGIYARGGTLVRYCPAFFGSVAVVFGILTFERNLDYRTAEGIWTDTVAKRPRNALARTMYGEVLDRDGKTNEALGQFEESVRLDPEFALSQENLGEVLFKLGRRPEAIARYQEALRLRPDFADAHDNLGVALAQKGDIAGAVPHFRKAIQVYPEYPEAHYNLADVLAETGHGEEAISEYETAIRFKPEYSQAEFNLANTFSDLGRREEAVSHYEAALRLKPDYPEAHYNLGNVLAIMHRQKEAIEHYAAAVKLRPNYAEAECNWGSALFELGRYDEARAHYEETLRIDPNFNEARINLSRLSGYQKDNTAN